MKHFFFWLAHSFFIGYNLDAHNTLSTLTPYVHTRARPYTRKERDWEATSSPMRGKHVVPPNAHACVYPEISVKFLEKGVITRILILMDRVLLYHWTTYPFAMACSFCHS